MLTPPIAAEVIRALVPQQGAMCLIETVLSWDAAGILCETGQHAAAGNPLRRDGRLPAVCGLEFAFQAMALHGAISASAEESLRRQRPGLVASLRGVSIAVERLDDIPGPLRIAAEALASGEGGFSYRFQVSSVEGRALLGGQALVVLPGAAVPA